MASGYATDAQAGVGIGVVNFYEWQKQLFENGAAAFERKTKSRIGMSRSRFVLDDQEPQGAPQVAPQKRG